MFPTTNWATLAEATLNGGKAERDALGRICEKYRDPLQAVIRARGVPEERVEDVVQDFLVTLMEGGFFRRADRERGKFRSFLLNALRNFLVDDTRRTMAIKRGGELQRVELKEDVASFEADESRFDLAWAEALFDAAIEAVGADVIAKRGEEGWSALRSFLTGSTEAMSYADLGDFLGLSEGGAKAEVSRMRGKFREQLRSEIRQTVSAPHEIDEELTYLREAMSRVWGAGGT